ncbi:MAG: VTC domain-containing protein [Myxococcales bacterium]|nr:VTC domain-containing protein [Myxococcales bacterium]
MAGPRPFDRGPFGHAPAARVHTWAARGCAVRPTSITPGWTASVLAPIATALRPGPLRHEVKWLVRAEEGARLAAWVRTHRAGFRSGFADRVVTSVYYDSVVLEDFLANGAGLSLREKVRLRWYGATWTPVQAQLEVKGRIDTVGWKASAAMAASLDLHRQTWREITALLRAAVTGTALQPHIDARPEPVLITRYRRSYFLSRDERLRVTIDADVVAMAQIGRMRPELRQTVHQHRVLVVELKCAAAERDLAGDALRDLPWRTGRHSKYASGVTAWLGE